MGDVSESIRGWYRHYKGNLYYVTGYVHNATNGADTVAYVLYHRHEGDPNLLFVREAPQFFGQVDHEGQRVFRFEKIESFDHKGN